MVIFNEIRLKSCKPAFIRTNFILQFTRDKMVHGNKYSLGMYS